MKFCIGCGKQMHETAQNCPFCGAVQNNFVIKNNNYHWTSVASLASAIIVFLLIITEPYWDRDAAVSGLFFAIAPLVFGVLSLKEDREHWRWMGVVGVVVGWFTLLVSLDSL